MYQFVIEKVAAWLKATGRWGRYLADTARGAREIRIWAGLTAIQMRRIGVQSLPIALFIAVFTGIVLALLSSYTLTGAVPLYFVGTLVGKAVMVELAPVLTGLALAGRVGANIAAELGTMRVTEQVDALETLKDFDTQGLCGPINYTPTIHNVLNYNKLFKTDPASGRYVAITDWKLPPSKK